ncbi:MAG TPA: hypothetical protein VNX01_07620 [Bacteroidia bacterium]|jgi:hypothetical protein|nr:hypothetical protein [Bacteroidia bacterium]
MLNENNVRDILINYLEGKKHKIISSCDTNSKGIDIIALDLKTKNELHIEVKGETSSKKHTARYGKPFDSKQIRTHISRAVFSAMKVISLKPVGSKTVAAIALPKTKGHVSEFDNVKKAVKKLNIKIFWVDEKTVSEE